MNAPAARTVFTAIQSILGWSEQTGTNIGGTPPSAHSFTPQTPWFPNKILLSVTGIKDKFCDWLAGCPPLPLGDSPGDTFIDLQLRIVFTVDSGFAANAQAAEFDTKWTDAQGVTYNGSLQFDCSQSPTTMNIMIDKAGGGWIDIGATLDKFAPYALHELIVRYQSNVELKTYSILSVRVDGVNYVPPASLQNLPGKNVGWAKSEILAQVQQDVNEGGGTWEEMLYNMEYEVW